MLKNPEFTKWNAAIHAEIKNMTEMGVWKAGSIVKQPPAGARIVDTTWAFAKKYDSSGKLEKFKARLCGRGFHEIKGIDYDEVYAPAVKQKVIRALTAIAASRSWTPYSDDFKAAYLNAVLKEPRWIQLPDGNYVMIYRALYGLKESARLWFQTLRDYLLTIGFKQSAVEPCIFTRKSVIIGAYSDDTYSIGPHQEVMEFRNELKSRFKLSMDGGECKKFLSMRFTNSPDHIKIDQDVYLNEKLQFFEKFISDNPKLQVQSPLLPNFQDLILTAEAETDTEPDFPYRAMVGSLVYLANGTRFDISAALSIVSRFNNNPKKTHCNMVRRIYQYLRGSRRSLVYKKGLNFVLNGYCDASYANLEDYSSLAGYCFTLGDTAVTWKSFKEPVKALSTAESEYIALTSTVQECIWLKQLLEGLGYKQDTVEIYEDNASCIALSKNPQEKRRTRHIQVRFHWIREQLTNGVFKLTQINTLKQNADILTKGLHGPQINTISNRLGLIRDSVKQGGN